MVTLQGKKHLRETTIECGGPVCPTPHPTASQEDGTNLAMSW